MINQDGLQSHQLLVAQQSPYNQAYRKREGQKRKTRQEKKNNCRCEYTRSYIAEHIVPLSKHTRKHINYAGALISFTSSLLLEGQETYEAIQESGSLTEVFIDSDNILLIRSVKEKKIKKESE